MPPSSPNRLNSLGEVLNADVPLAEDKAAAPEAETITPEEEAMLRAEKLRTIREAIDRGSYDSDELLDEAMRRMQNAIENGQSIPVIPSQNVKNGIRPFRNQARSVGIRAHLTADTKAQKIFRVVFPSPGLSHQKLTESGIPSFADLRLHVSDFAPKEVAASSG